MSKMTILLPAGLNLNFSVPSSWKDVNSHCGFIATSPPRLKTSESSSPNKFSTSVKICEGCMNFKQSTTELSKTNRMPQKISRVLLKHRRFCQISSKYIAFLSLVPGKAAAAEEFVDALLKKSKIFAHLQALVESGSIKNSFAHLGHDLQCLGTQMLDQTDRVLHLILADVKSFSFLLESAQPAFNLASSSFTHNLASPLGHQLGQTGSSLYSTYSFPFTTACFAAMASSTVMVSASDPTLKSNVTAVEPFLTLKYDPQNIEAYIRKRPHKLVLRFLKAAVECSTLITNILSDTMMGQLGQKENLRAAQFLELIARLGPTAIKIGQALSIRPDILPKAYIEELQKLQDRVPPFSNEIAMDLIVSSLGKPADEVFTYISEEPVAAASLGQVYKAVLRDSGENVAVKVQRPGVIESISLDIYILRTLSSLINRLPSVHTDFTDLLDNWAVRFFNELDYIQEADNAERFAKDMKGLCNVIVPKPFRQYTTQKVLITAWVEGEKLSESKAADQLLLVSTALNCYLIQLLESGFLHADPHPGNLLRTPHGNLCVLDFGLMTEVTEDQQYTLVEYIAHLMNADYALVAEDLIKLGFVPAEQVDPEKTAAILPQLSQVLGQLVQGGGARKMNMQQVTDGIGKISKDYAFVIPPYFALILRAFSVLEGIGLEADPDYAIVEECAPYISKRLLTDDSPRARAILKYFLYAGKRQLDVQRLEAIMSGFRTFRKSVSMKEINGALITPSLDPTAKKALLMLLAPEGSYIQELVLAELVRMVDALSRGALAELWKLSVSASSFLLPFPAGSWLLPILDWNTGVTRVSALTEEDRESLDILKRLLMLLQFQLKNETSTAGIAEVAQGVLPIFWDLVPGCASVSQRFIVMLAQRQALRLADNLDGRKSISDWDKDPSALARQIRPIRFLPPPTRMTSKLKT